MAKTIQVSILERAIEMLSNPDNWTTRANFRDENGDECDVSQAKKMCAQGAYMKAAVDLGVIPANHASAITLWPNVMLSIRSAIAWASPGCTPIHAINDIEGREAAVAVLETARNAMVSGRLDELKDKYAKVTGLPSGMVYPCNVEFIKAPQFPKQSVYKEMYAGLKSLVFAS